MPFGKKWPRKYGSGTDRKSHCEFPTPPFACYFQSGAKTWDIKWGHVIKVTFINRRAITIGSQAVYPGTAMSESTP